MTEYDLLIGCVLAMLFGAVGQGFRAIGGLKKRADRNTEGAILAAAQTVAVQAVRTASAAGAAPPAPAAASAQIEVEPFNGYQLAGSFAIGAVAGIAAYLGLRLATDKVVELTSGPTILGIIAAGYSGSDFIESFVKKHLPN